MQSVVEQAEQVRSGRRSAMDCVEVALARIAAHNDALGAFIVVDGKLARSGAERVDEMLERGDWIVPVFNAELRAHKPVLLYWLMMSAYAVLGVNEFAARFWSAVLSVGTVVLTYHIGRYLFDAIGRT